MGNFPKVLKELRRQSGLTQADLANKMNISRSSVGMYEKGEREPDFETLEAIADFFNVDMNLLLGKADMHAGKKGYYIDDEAAIIAQEIYDNPNLRILFDTTRKVKPEDLKLISEMVKRMSSEDEE